MPGLPIRKRQLFALVCLLLDTVSSFEVLPYVHIDYAYYNRLAQCQAKCTEKYGTMASRRLLDGRTRQFFDTASEAYRMCELGCSHTRILSAKHARSLADAFKDGQEFWKASGRDA
ncbi:Protein C16B8.4, partial [Aphelenchoides avenae]